MDQSAAGGSTHTQNPSASVSASPQDVTGSASKLSTQTASYIPGSSKPPSQTPASNSNLLSLASLKTSAPYIPQSVATGTPGSIVSPLETLGSPNTALAALKKSAPYIPTSLSGTPSGSGSSTPSLSTLSKEAKEFRPTGPSHQPSSTKASAVAPLINAPEYRPQSGAATPAEANGLSAPAFTPSAATASAENTTWGEDDEGYDQEYAVDYEEGDDALSDPNIDVENDENGHGADDDADLLEGMTFFTPYGVHPGAYLMSLSVHGMRSPTAARSPYLSRNYGGTIGQIEASAISRAPMPLFVDDNLAESLQNRVSLLSLRALPEDRVALSAAQTAATQAATTSAMAVNPTGSVDPAAALAAATNAAASAVISDVCPQSISSVDMDEAKRGGSSSVNAPFTSSSSLSSTSSSEKSSTEYSSQFSSVSSSYSNLFPLPTDMSRAIIGSPSLPYPTFTFKAQCNEDGTFVLIKRVAGARVTISQAKANAEPWIRLQSEAGSRASSTFKTLGTGPEAILPQHLHAHPNLVAIRNIFMSSDFSDKRSLCFAYDYHPGAQTLFQRYLCGPSTIPNCVTGVPFTEQQFWSTAVQILAALSAVHAAQLTASGMLDPTGSRILRLPSGRIKIAGAAYLSTMMEAPSIVPQPYQRFLLQHQDLVNLAKLLLALSCQSLGVLQSPNSVERGLQHVSSALSDECASFLKKMLVITPAMTASAAASAQNQGNDMFAVAVGDSPANYRSKVMSGNEDTDRQGFEAAFQPPPGFLTADMVLASIASKVVNVMEQVQASSDMFEDQLSREFHNGRLLRLLLKLGYINERPEYQHNPHWCDTGDRYPLKLFRDYVFHQVNSDGTPSVDMSFTIDALNKLDAGTNENVLLTSRQEDSLLVVSYRDLNRCLNGAFHELYTAKPTSLTNSESDTTSSQTASLVSASAAALGHQQPGMPRLSLHGAGGKIDAPSIAMTATSVNFLANLAGSAGVAAQVAASAAAASAAAAHHAQGYHGGYNLHGHGHMPGSGYQYAPNRGVYHPQQMARAPHHGVPAAHGIAAQRTAYIPRSHVGPNPGRGRM